MTDARPDITTDDLIAALEEIEMLTASGTGLDPDTTMRVHLLAGIGRATHDQHAWYARPGSGGDEDDMSEVIAF